MVHHHAMGRSLPEPPSFEEALVGLQPQLLAYAIRLTGSREDGEELAQETLYKALKSKEGYQEAGNLRGWLFMIAKYQFLSERRQDKFRGEWDQELFERTLTNEGEVSEAEATIDLRRLLHCLALINQDRSDAVIAVGYLGFSYEEGALRLDIETGTMKSRVSRGRDDLSRLFNGQEKLPPVDLYHLKTATQLVPATHPYYPIAKAYEDLYASSDLESEDSHVEVSKEETAWRALVASGALDTDTEGWDSLARGD